MPDVSIRVRISLDKFRTKCAITLRPDVPSPFSSNAAPSSSKSTVGLTHGYETFTLAYYEGGKRVRRTFPSLAAAKTEAELVATRLDRADSLALQLTGTDRQQYLLATAELQTTGIPLHLAIKEFVAAKAILGEGSLLDAARLHRAHTDPTRPQRAVEAVADECLVAKTGDGLSARYLVQLRSDLKRFAHDFRKNIADVTGPESDDWLRGLRYDGAPISGRTRNNLRTSIGTLFSFARQRGYLAKNTPTEAESVSKAKVVEDETKILTIAQMKSLLAESTGVVRARMAIAGFAMVRTAQLARLHWEHINLTEMFLTANAMDSKPSRRRLVPISENLKSWLEPLLSRGPVLPNDEVFKQVTEHARTHGIEWERNYLRNSAISYRLATTQNVAQVAYEAGTSANVIFRNYRQLATPAQGHAWFAIST